MRGFRDRRTDQTKGTMMIRLRFIFAVAAAAGLLLTPVPAAAEYQGRHPGRFVVNANGIITDLVNGLEWFAGPDVDTSYYQAAEWVRGLTVGGGGWRMPTAKELNTLYREPGKMSTITPLLKTGGIHIWPYQDNEDLSLYLFRYMDPFGTRAFAVRPANGNRSL